jgi:uncharacterized membrane protein
MAYAGQPRTGQQAAEDQGPAGVTATGASLPGKARADWVPWLISLAVFVAYSTISISRYARLDPGSWDLGIFTEGVKQYAHLRAPITDIHGAGFNLLGDHFQPIVALIAPLFRVFPSPVTLLLAQALLTAVSVIPVSRAAAARLGTGPARMIGAAYGFSWGLQQMIDFDFHEIAFAVPLLACSLSALLRGRTRAAVLWALPLVLVKEDQGLTVAALGMLMMATAGERLGSAFRGHRPGAASRDGADGSGDAFYGGLLLIVWGLSWSILSIAVIIPHFNATHQYPYWADGGVIGPGAGHPSAAALLGQFGHAHGQKLTTTALILLPVAFLALRSPLVLVAVPSLVLRFLSTNSYFWGTTWHYNATVMPIVFIAAIDALARFQAAHAARVARRSPPEPAPPATASLDDLLRGTAPQAAAPPTEQAPAQPVAGHPVAAQPGPAGPGPARPAARYAAALMLVIAVVLAFRFPLDGLWNAQTYQVDGHVQAENAAMARVPDGVTVEATLTMIAPLAARDDTFWIGTSGNPPPEYIVFDESSSGWNPAPPDPLTFVEQRHPGVAYQQIFLAGQVYVFRRS